MTGDAISSGFRWRFAAAAFPGALLGGLAPDSSGAGAVARIEASAVVAELWAMRSGGRRRRMRTTLVWIVWHELRTTRSRRSAQNNTTQKEDERDTQMLCGMQAKVRREAAAWSYLVPAAVWLTRRAPELGRVRRRTGPALRPNLRHPKAAWRAASLALARRGRTGGCAANYREGHGEVGIQVKWYI